MIQTWNCRKAEKLGRRTHFKFASYFFSDFLHVGLWVVFIQGLWVIISALMSLSSREALINTGIYKGFNLIIIVIFSNPTHVTEKKNTNNLPRALSVTSFVILNHYIQYIPFFWFSFKHDSEHYIRPLYNMNHLMLLFSFKNCF